MKPLLIDQADSFQLVHRQIQPVEVLRSSLQNICGHFQIEPPHKRTTLSSHLSVRQLNELELAQVGLDASEVTRTRKDIRVDPGDHFFLILQREGCAYLSQNSVEARIEPGDMFLVDSTLESRFRYNGDYSLQLSVHLPRDEMLHRFGRRIKGGETIDKSDPIGLSMRALLARLCTDNNGPQGHVVEAFYSVFGALLEERAQQRKDHSHPDRRVIQRALTLIAEHYSDPAFSTTQLAGYCGVSLRRLQRAFKLIGETPHTRLQLFRLTSARAVLMNHQNARHRPSIASIAYQCGFSDLSTFYRLYRKSYGEPPGQVLEKAQDLQLDK